MIAIPNQSTKNPHQKERPLHSANPNNEMMRVHTRSACVVLYDTEPAAAPGFDASCELTH